MPFTPFQEGLAASQVPRHEECLSLLGYSLGISMRRDTPESPTTRCRARSQSGLVDAYTNYRLRGHVHKGALDPTPDLRLPFVFQMRRNDHSGPLPVRLWPPFHRTSIFLSQRVVELKNTGVLPVRREFFSRRGRHHYRRVPVTSPRLSPTRRLC